MGLLLLAGASPRGSHRETADEAAAATADVQGRVDGLRARMGIAAEVEVQLVDRDERVVSVRARRSAAAPTFSLAFERGFLQRLSDAELEAALAHELGHVWIATHHPYLQTEQLANRIALRAVKREALVAVYRTLWGADAVHGSLEAFLGVAGPAVGAAQVSVSSSAEPE